MDALIKIFLTCVLFNLLSITLCICKYQYRENVPLFIRKADYFVFSVGIVSLAIWCISWVWSY